MGGEFARREVETALSLAVPGRAPLEVAVASVSAYAPESGPRRVVIEVRVDLETFQRIEDEALLGFAPAAVDPETQDYALISTAPVELELAPELAALGDLAAAPLEALLDGVEAALRGAAPGALGEASIYRWLTALQEREVRPGLTVRRGLRSIFA